MAAHRAPAFIAGCFTCSDNFLLWLLAMLATLIWSILSRLPEHEWLKSAQKLLLSSSIRTQLIGPVILTQCNGHAFPPIDFLIYMVLFLWGTFSVRNFFTLKTAILLILVSNWSNTGPIKGDYNQDCFLFFVRLCNADSVYQIVCMIHTVYYTVYTHRLHTM